MAGEYWRGCRRLFLFLGDCVRRDRVRAEAASVFEKGLYSKVSKENGETTSAPRTSVFAPPRAALDAGLVLTDCCLIERPPAYV